MGINIFAGAAGGSNKSKGRTTATSSAAARAAATTAAIGPGAVASDSGSTAVQSNGMLGKVGGFLNKISSVAQYMPGMVGTIGGIVNKLTSANDPEWWMSVPGDGLTCNDPFQFIRFGSLTPLITPKFYNAQTEEAVECKSVTFGAIRPTFLELNVAKIDGFTIIVDLNSLGVIKPDDRMITQYLLPHVRKVVNAVYLQDSEHYRKALEAQATIYALWRQLKKIDYFLKHGKSYVPNTNVDGFPVFQVENAAWLQSTITRLEEYLHSNVRLPHTLCEYLTWRFGRIYKTNRSAKASFVLYNVITLRASISQWNTAIAYLQNVIANDTAVQKASTDIYNAYLDHDQEVYLAEDNVCAWDPKEFVLRTNLDLADEAAFFARNKVSNNILMDSDLDNPTTFMASTVSCQVKEDQEALFPVRSAYVYYYCNDYDWRIPAGAGSFHASDARLTGVYTAREGDPSAPFDEIIPIGMQYAARVLAPSATMINEDNQPKWFYVQIKPGAAFGSTNDPTNPWCGDVTIYMLPQFLLHIALCKAMEFYNVGLYAPFGLFVDRSAGYIPAGYTCLMHDCTSLTQDEGIVDDIVIINEQVLAFANLMAIEHRDKTTYRQVEKRVAKDVANMVESVPVAEISK